MKPLSDIDTIETDDTEEDTREISLPGGCILCGGDLDVRMGPDGAGSFCKACRWISRPHMKREGTQVHVIHPAGGLA